MLVISDPVVPVSHIPLQQELLLSDCMHCHASPQCIHAVIVEGKADKVREGGSEWEGGGGVV